MGAKTWLHINAKNVGLQYDNSQSIYGPLFAFSADMLVPLCFFSPLPRSLSVCLHPCTIGLVTHQFLLNTGRYSCL